MNLSLEEITETIVELNDISKRYNQKYGRLLRAFPTDKPKIYLRSKQEVSSTLHQETISIASYRRKTGTIYIVEDNLEMALEIFNKDIQAITKSDLTREVISSSFLRYVIMHENVHRSCRTVHHAAGKFYLRLVTDDPRGDSGSEKREDNTYVTVSGLHLGITDSYTQRDLNAHNLDEFVVDWITTKVLAEFGPQDRQKALLPFFFIRRPDMRDKSEYLPVMKAMARAPTTFIQDYFRGAIPTRVYNESEHYRIGDPMVCDALGGIAMGRMSSLPSILNIGYRVKNRDDGLLEEHH